MELETLVAMNLRFPERENAGDRPYFEARLAPSFSMRRANGAVVDRERFLGDLKSGGERRALGVGQVTLLGRSRALVLCQVRVGAVVYDNLRMFVRDAAAPEGWFLLSWANEESIATDAES